jgi:hypothetical protein
MHFVLQIRANQQQKGFDYFGKGEILCFGQAKRQETIYSSLL